MEHRAIALCLNLIYWIGNSSSAPVTANLLAGGGLLCEAGWNLIEGECVAVVYTDQRTSFDQALTTCQNVDATLPIVHSEEEWNRRAKQINQSDLRGDTWLGLAHNPQSNRFRWMDGTNMTWSNFLVYPETVDRMITNCVLTNNSYKWFIQECSHLAPFICIKAAFYSTAGPTTVTSTAAPTKEDAPVTVTVTEVTKSTTPLLPRCSDSSKRAVLGIGCLLDSEAWEQARLACQQQSRTLVYTKSKEEWVSFQASRVPYPNMDNIWIGLRYNQKNKRIETPDGSPWRPSPNDWFPWSSGQPPPEDAFTDDSCAASAKKLNYMWTFEGCNQSSYVGLCYSTRQPLEPATDGPTVSASTSSSAPRSSFIPKVKDDGPTAVSTGRLPTTKRPRNFTPKIMNQAERISSIVIQSMGCVFIIGGISLTLLLFVIFRDLSIEKIIIANQDLALLFAHCFVLTLREPALYPSMSPQLCKTVAVLLHYFFTCSYTFMLLEALQMMYIIGHVNKSGAILPTYVFLALGWGLPLALVAITGPIIGDEYSTPWTCWGDLERRFGWALFFPMVCICSCTMIIVESAGIMNRQDPPHNADPVQLFSAKISQRGIVIVMSLTVASHILGIVAVYFQVVYLYVACFGLNVSCGTAVVFFHTAVDSKIRAFVVKVWKKIRQCEIRNYKV